MKPLTFIVGSFLIIPLIPSVTEYHAPVIPMKTIVAEVTAYTSSVEETDETPEITASGEKVRDGIVACPHKYPFGTRVVIASRTYTCADRMNQRYRHSEYFDIWVADKASAKEWGRQKIEVAIEMN